MKLLLIRTLFGHPVHKSLTMLIDRPIRGLKFIRMLDLVSLTAKLIRLAGRNVKKQIIFSNKDIHFFYISVFHRHIISRKC